MNARHWSLAALWLLAAGALVAYGWSNLRPSAAALARAAEIAEKRAAELAGESFPAGLTLPMLTPFRDGWGDRLEFDTYRGRRPIVVNVWASWCPPCAREAPLLEAAWQRFQTRQFVGEQPRPTLHALAVPVKNDVTTSRISGTLRTHEFGCRRVLRRASGACGTQIGNSRGHADALWTAHKGSRSMDAGPNAPAPNRPRV